MIEVALFDLDDALFAHAEAMRTAVGSASAFDRWHALEEHHYHRYLAGELTFIEQRLARVRDFVGHPLTDDEAADWYAEYFARYRAAWSLHGDALPCLSLLAGAGVRLGLITNGERSFQQEKLDATGVTRLLEHIVASGEIGATKPDPRIFSAACGAFGVAPERALYVGDRFETDALGAAGAGLAGVWLDRLGVATSAERSRAASAGVAIIRSLAELPPLVLGS